MSPSAPGYAKGSVADGGGTGSSISNKERDGALSRRGG